MTEPHDTDDPAEPAEPESDIIDPALEETNHQAPSSRSETLEVSAFFDDSADLAEEEMVVDTTPTVLEEGASLGKYQIKKLLGRGGMGAVYLGFDPLIEREVAIKVLPNQTANASQAFERFLAEARATGKLNHPNVVAIYEINQQGDTNYIVMELVRGGSASDYIADRENIDWLEALRIAANAADGLAAAHRTGLVHRDIKPDNLMLTEDHAAKVVDFGLSKLVNSTSERNLNLTTEGQLLGTPRYMSPEQFEGESVDARSDVYCLGGTLFALLTGHPPFAHANNMVAVMKAHVSDPPPDPLQLNPQLPTEIRAIVAKAMAKRPADRYQHAGELAQALWDLYHQCHAAESRTPREAYRPCHSALIVEPSRMQAMMLAKQLEQHGIGRVTTVDTATAAKSHCQSEACDLVVTALQLGDQDGVGLLAELQQNPKLSQSTLVLNSADVTSDQFLSIRHTSTIAIVPKRTKPKSLVQSLLACTHFDFEMAVSDTEVDGSRFRLGLILDSARVPESLAQLVRQSNLLDFTITTFDQLAAGSRSMPQRDLILAIRNAGETVNDNRVYAELLERLSVDCANLAAIQATGEELKLRAFHREGFMAAARLPLDIRRWQRLLQACAV